MKFFMRLFALPFVLLVPDPGTAGPSNEEPVR